MTTSPPPPPDSLPTSYAIMREKRAEKKKNEEIAMEEKKEKEVAKHRQDKFGVRIIQKSQESSEFKLNWDSTFSGVSGRPYESSMPSSKIIDKLFSQPPCE